MGFRDFRDRRVEGWKQGSCWGQSSARWLRPLSVVKDRVENFCYREVAPVFSIVAAESPLLAVFTHEIVVILFCSESLVPTAGLFCMTCDAECL